MDLLKYVRRLIFLVRYWFFKKRKLFLTIIHSFIIIILLFWLFDGVVINDNLMKKANFDYTSKNYEKALSKYKTASIYYGILKPTDSYKLKNADIHFKIAKSYYALGNKEQSDLSILRGIMHITNDYGSIHEYVADYLRDQAADYYTETKNFKRAYNSAKHALEIYKSVGISGIKVADAYRATGKIYFVKNNIEKAGLYYEKALDVLNGLYKLDYEIYTRILLDVSVYYKYKQQYTTIENLLNKALEKFDADLITEGRNRIRVLKALSNAYFLDNDNQKGAIVYGQAVELIEKLPSDCVWHRNLEAEYNKLAGLYKKASMHAESRNASQKALRIKRLK